MSAAIFCPSMEPNSDSTRLIGADGHQLAVALLPTVTPLDRSFVVYDEAEKVTETKTQPANIASSYQILDCLHSMSENISFTREAWKQCIKELYDQNNELETWRLKACDFNDYQTTMTRRMMNLCRSVRQGELKARRSSSIPDWVKNLPWWDEKQVMS